MITVSEPAPGETILLGDVTWSEYEQYLAAAADRPLRTTYDRGRFEIVSPSDVHERLEKLLDRLLSAIAEEWNVPIRSQGSTTFRRETLDRGLEPDECYYVGNEPALRGRDEIDPDRDPPPDLAIEVDISRSSLDRLDVYAALGVPEVWRCDGRRLMILRLAGDRTYARGKESLAFPRLTAKTITTFLDRRNTADEVTWIREFREWLRERDV